MINNDRYFFENPNQFTGYNQSNTVLNYWKNQVIRLVSQDMVFSLRSLIQG